MTEEQIALARRAVACKGFRWMPGMLAAPTEGMVSLPVRLTDELPHDLGLRLPDLTDAATLGCLLALVRTAYGDPALYVRLSDTTRQSDGVRAWEVLGWLDLSRNLDGRGGWWRGWGYATEAEALVAALEAAP
jgi:hypothetical protein